MVDIHSHLIWGVDDGAQSMEESISMLRMAQECGTTDIVATPHANDRYPYDRPALEIRLNELRAAAGALPQIHLGCDFHLSFANIESALNHRERYTINGLRYLMVELPDLMIPPGMDRAFEHLQEAGMIPVITHPERNRALWSDEKRFGRWIDAGCYVQITAQSLEGRFGRSAKDLALRILDQGRAHFVASDAHNLESRPPRLDLAYKIVASRHGAEEAGRLFVENPRQALLGQPLQSRVGKLPSAKTRFRFFR